MIPELKTQLDRDMIFPLVTLEYEGQFYSAPSQYLAYVERIYGDIYQLPQDMLTHYQHVPHQELETKKIQNRIQEFVSSKGGTL